MEALRASHKAKQRPGQRLDEATRRHQAAAKRVQKAQHALDTAQARLAKEQAKATPTGNPSTRALPQQQGNSGSRAPPPQPQTRNQV